MRDLYNDKITNIRKLVHYNIISLVVNSNAMVKKRENQLKNRA